METCLPTRECNAIDDIMTFAEASNVTMSSGTTEGMSEQAGSFVSTLLPPQGLSFTSVLKQLQEPLPENGQEESNKYDVAEELEHGINLVVKATYWCCMDCNIKHSFGSGESIEDHLRVRHNIFSRTEDAVESPVVTENPLITQENVVSPTKMATSDTIASVYTIPSTSVPNAGLAMDTLIVLEDDTALQVLTNPLENDGMYSTSSETLVSKIERTVHDSDSLIAHFGLSGHTSCVELTSAPTATSIEMKPIPVIPALPPTTCTAVSSASSSVKPDDTSDGLSLINHFCTPSHNSFTSQTTQKSTPESKTNTTRLQIVTNNNLGKASSLISLAGTSVETHTSISHETNNQTQILNETQQNTVAECQCRDCTIQLKRLTAEEISQLTKELKSLSQKSVGMGQYSKVSKRTSSLGQFTNRKKSVHSLKRECQFPVPQQPHKKSRHSLGTDNVSIQSKMNCSPQHGLRSSCGRRVRKPARYRTDFDSEGEVKIESQSWKGENLSVSSQSNRKIIKMSHGHSDTNLSDDVSMEKKLPPDVANTNLATIPVAKKFQEGKYSCLDCGRKFTFEKKLKKHNEMYSGQPMQQCSLCQFKMHSPDLLNVHLYYVHKTQESTSCTACGLVLGSKRNLLYHLLTHPSSKGQTVANLVKDSCNVHQCEYCDEPIVEGEGRVEKHYLRHKKTHLHQCQRCGQRFVRKRELYHHLKTHSVLKEIVSSDKSRTEQEGMHSEHEHSLLPDGDFSECQTERNSSGDDKESSLLISKLQVPAKAEDTSIAVVGQAGCLENNELCKTQGETTSTESPESLVDRLRMAESVLGEIEIQDSEFQPAMIAESVAQIVEYKESTLKSSNIPVSVTFISTEAIESKAGYVRAKSLSDGTSTSSSFYCQLCNNCFTTKKQLYLHLKNHGTNRSVRAEDEDGLLAGREEDSVCQPIDISKGVPFGIPCSLVKLEGLQGVEDFLMKSFTTTPEGLVVPQVMHYTCALCEQNFESEKKARRHINHFGQQQTIVQCNHCPQKFHNLDLFNVHYVYEHRAEGSAVCMTCSKEFSNKGDFITHLGSSPVAHPLSHKLGIKTFLRHACGTVTCSLCQKSMWNYPMNIANHTKMHKNFLCPICQQGFPYKYALMTHLQVHANNKILNRVSELSQGETEQVQFAAEVNSLHTIILSVESPDFVEGNEKFSCTLCEGEVWCQRKNIHRHLDLHARRILHILREGRYFCHECGEDIILSDHSILDHYKSQGHSVLPLRCVFCSLEFDVFEEYKTHEIKKHWLNIYFEKSMCEVCGKELANRQELKKHVQLHEERQGLFSCPHCSQTFRFESKLQKHLSKHNSGRNSFACQFCGKLYMTKISLDRHEQVDHVGIKDFKHKCRLCDAQFINATHLRDHVTIKHTGGACYTCSLCGMGFKHRSTYVRHQRVQHAGDTPYVCQECGEKFPVKKDLQKHSAIHTGINPFQCTVCLKTFSVERTLREHFDFVHRGIIKFTCKSCGGKFPRKRNLERHMSTCRMASVLS